MKIAVADLRPNPFRDLKRYPLKLDKVAALQKSIHDTTFWDNVLVRKAPNGDGGYELAYGHSRLQALKDEKIRFIDVPCRDLSDTDMARIMAHENMEEWGSSADVETETIRSIIQGYADGRIKLQETKRREGTGGALRYAPRFTVGRADSARGELAYTAESLADFLGWKPWRVQAALDVLAAAEQETLDERDTAYLTTKQAATVAAQTRRIERETEDKDLARKIGTRLAEGMRTAAGRSLHDTRGKNTRVGGSVTIHNARQKADEMVPPHKRKIPPSTKLKQLPPIEKYVLDLAPKLGPLFPSPKMKERLEAIIKHAEYLPKGPGRVFIKSLRALGDRAYEYADRLAAAMGV